MPWPSKLISCAAGVASASGSDALASPILILGAPRSGTTWLAKIIDSHPNVLYRHEPDETLPVPLPLIGSAVPGLVQRWAAARNARTVTKKPFFPKSWQPGWARALRTLIVAGINVAERLPSPLRALARIPIPDLAAHPAPRLAIKSVGWAEGAVILTRTLPASRTIFILRHPCGQVASVIRGNHQGRFSLRTAGTNMPFDEHRAIRYAAAHGIEEPAFQALTDAAKYAWSWRAFNEPAYAELAAQPNVHVLLYEALCTHPEPLSRRILAFVGLDWHQQTADFVACSTSHQGAGGYYAIFRDAFATAENWRTMMTPADQGAVREVVSSSPLARFWPDLLAVAVEPAAPSGYG